jgi:hypothetical protein
LEKFGGFATAVMRMLDAQQVAADKRTVEDIKMPDVEKGRVRARAPWRLMSLHPGSWRFRGRIISGSEITVDGSMKCNRIINAWVWLNVAGGQEKS